MEFQITKMNIEENNQKYMMIQKITNIFMSIVVSLLILLFLYFMSKNSYAFMYIIFFFIICADIDSVYNSAYNSSSVVVKEKEIENKDTDDVIKKKDDQLEKLLKKIKKMNKQINKSKIEIENLKNTIQTTPHSVDESQNDEATTVAASTQPSSPASVISPSDLEKLIDESIKQFESDDMIFVDNDNMD